MKWRPIPYERKLRCRARQAYEPHDISTAQQHYSTAVTNAVQLLYEYLGAVFHLSAALMWYTTAVVVMSYVPTP